MYEKNLKEMRNQNYNNHQIQKLDVNFTYDKSLYRIVWRKQFG